MIAKYLVPVVLLTIICLASFFRLYKLDQVPVSPYWEEVALGYDAYAILQTGKDHHGNTLPILAFPSYGDYKPSGYFYALVPFLQVFGLSTLAVRLPSALAGILSVFALYKIGVALHSQRLGILAAGVLAIQPWNIHFSRGGFEVNLALACLLCGVWALLNAQKRPLWLPVASLFFGYSMYTYHAARLFAPLVGGFLGLWLLYQWYRERTRSHSRLLARQQFLSLLCTTLVCMLVVTPFILNMKNQEVSSRFTQTSIFTDLEPILQSNEAIEKHGNTRIAKLLYHRYRYFAAIIFQNLVSHFSPNFLFWKGDGSLRHSIGKYGLVFPISGVFILYALYGATQSSDEKKSRKLLFACVIWILLSAFVPSLVKPTPHALRFLFASPAFALITALGMERFLTVCKPKTVTYRYAIIFTSFLLFVGLYTHWYYTIYPSQSASDWQYGYKELFTRLESLRKDNEPVFVSYQQGRPSMFYMFYKKIDPTIIQKQDAQVEKNQLEHMQVDFMYFGDAHTQKHGLHASAVSQTPSNAVPLDIIRSLDGSVVWVIWRNSTLP